MHSSACKQNCAAAVNRRTMTEGVSSGRFIMVAESGEPSGEYAVTWMSCQHDCNKFHQRGGYLYHISKYSCSAGRSMRSFCLLGIPYVQRASKQGTD